MKFEDIDKAQKAKALPKYLICGIDPADKRLVFLKAVKGDEHGNAVDWCIPLFETKGEAEQALLKSKMPSHYKVRTQQQIPTLTLDNI
ncbi:hypothetical protein, partial [Xanthomonas pisi]|uniref:hypothetical protein n=1 Tax=Xanthomonas pisi TaxID=56457 RepID=UPI000B133A50